MEINEDKIYKEMIPKMVYIAREKLRDKNLEDDFCVWCGMKWIGFLRKGKVDFDKFEAKQIEQLQWRFVKFKIIDFQRLKENNSETDFIFDLPEDLLSYSYDHE